jgi:HD-GYP domain-containing protein (c-di-GMP phosphodiesterase class II)
MRITRLRDALPGKYAAIDVLDQSGRKLVAAGMPLSGQSLAKLRDKGVTFLYLQDPDFRVNPVFSSGTVSGLLRVLYNYSASDGKDSSILKAYNTDEVRMFMSYSGEPASRMAYSHIFRYLAGLMRAELRKQGNVYFDFLDHRQQGAYLTYHSVNSACVALVIGVGMGLPDKELEDLCAGVLLSDVKMKLYGFTGENRLLTPVETEEMRMHVNLSHDEARKIYGMPAAAAGIILQHHERADGSGYPRGVKAGDISPAASAAAVADVYDSLISRRPHREAMFPDEAWDLIAANKGGIFGDEAVRAFKKTVAKYIPGDIVELLGGEKAVVTCNFAGRMEDPGLKLIEKNPGNDIISDAANGSSGQTRLKIRRTIKSARREE